MNTESMIELADLEVRYGPIQAVRGLSLQVRRGEIFGMLGPNGAGKTSTLGCIEGLLRPHAGRVVVAGFDLAREPDRARALMGVQLQRAALLDDLRAVELVELFAALYGRFPSRCDALALLERFGLVQKAQAFPRQLSGGQVQRLALVLALVNDPQVVLLDEPTTGLDPQARRGVWALIRRMRAEGRTVVLTTHAMEEAQLLCDRVGIIDGGVLVALGTPAELIVQHAPALPPEEAALRQPNLEDVFLALTGRGLGGDSGDGMVADEEWQVVEA